MPNEMSRIAVVPRPDASSEFVDISSVEVVASSFDFLDVVVVVVVEVVVGFVVQIEK